MKAAAETTLAIAADPKRLGARIGITAVLHTWGSALTHHPHVHMIVPGGGLSLDGTRWVACRSNFLMHVNVLARVVPPADAGDADACTPRRSAELLQRPMPGSPTSARSNASSPPLRTSIGWSTVRRRSQGPSRCCAIFPATPTVSRSPTAGSGSRRYRRRVPLQGLPDRRSGPLEDHALHPHEFIRRFLMHVLPKGFHRIRHYGLFASGNRSRAHRAPRASSWTCRRTRCRRQPPRAETPMLTTRSTAMPLLRRPHEHHRDLQTRLQRPEHHPIIVSGQQSRIDTS